MTTTTETTISVTDAPYTPYRDTHTNYLVRVQYEYDRTDFIVFGPVGMIASELRSLIKERFPRDEATSIVKFVQL